MPVAFGDWTLTVGAEVTIGDFSYVLGITDNNDLVLLVKSVTPVPYEDTVAPTVSGIMASATGPTNQNVVVTAVFMDDVKLAQSLYRIGATGNWSVYVDGVTVFENGTICFKAVDAAGNGNL